MLVASSQILSCSCGLIFPFLSTLPHVWYPTMVFSTVCWFVLFPRYYCTTVWIRQRLATETQKNTFTGRLIITANRLRTILIILWSLIVLNYFIFWSLVLLLSELTKLLLCCIGYLYLILYASLLLQLFKKKIYIYLQKNGSSEIQERNPTNLPDRFKILS